MPDILVMVAMVATVAEFIKRALMQIGVVLSKPITYAIVVLSGAGVVVYFYISTGTPFDMNIVWIIAQVVFYALFGYKAIKAAARPKTPQ